MRRELIILSSAAFVGFVPVANADSCPGVWEPGVFAGSAGAGSAVLCFATLDDGNGEALYLGGQFTQAGGVAASRIARWDGEAFTPLGSGVNGTLWALAVYDDGSGPALYAGGEFTTAGGEPVSYLARWDGSAWSPVGGGVNGEVWALAVYDDGVSGEALYVAGNFNQAGSVSVLRIAKWDGNEWSALGSGISGGSVRALEVANFGDGAALFAAGEFTGAGGSSTASVARWDGESWSALGAGIGGLVRAMAFDPAGPSLYFGGLFSSAGGSPAARIARWDGQNFHTIGTGLNNSCFALAVFDDGSGPALYAGGSFTNAGGTSASRIARWDGQQWTNLGSGVNNTVFALTESSVALEAPSAGALFAGGTFTSAGGTSSTRIAMWSRPGMPSVEEHPEDITVAGGAQAVFTVIADGAEPLHFQWRRDGVNLEAPGGNGNISGPDTDTLIIDPVTPDDAGVYDVVVTNDCAQVISEPAVLGVDAVLGDLNGDGVVDVSDLLILLGAWGECPDPTPGSCPADLNGDGTVDVSDLLILLGNWG